MTENLILSLLSFGCVMLPFGVIALIEELIVYTFYIIHKLLGGKKSLKHCRKYLEFKTDKLLKKICKI